MGASLASAHGIGGFGWFGTQLTPDEIVSRQQTAFQNEANLLGVSVDVVKSGWAQGKSLQQVATENGMTADQLQQKLKDVRLTQLKSQLQTLVNRGVITQAQADARLQFMQNRAQNGMGHMGKGFHGFRL